MPYPFAHPAAVLPLARPMGRFAVPSALAIGSVAPDLWYFVPLVGRTESHSLAALAWFCLPAGLLAYALFHLVLKEPLIALLSPRLGHFACSGLPPARRTAVGASLLVGALTHVAWDALTHSNDYAIRGHNWLQHASTALGTLVLAWWAWRKLRHAPLPAARTGLSRIARTSIFFTLLAAAALAGCWSAVDAGSLRSIVRSGGIAAAQTLALAIFVYCAVWHLRTRQMTSA